MAFEIQVGQHWRERNTRTLVRVCKVFAPVAGSDAKAVLTRAVEPQCELAYGSKVRSEERFREQCMFATTPAGTAR